MSRLTTTESAAGSRPVCAITGGAGGIGLATARQFAAQGYCVSLCGRDPGRLEAAAASLPPTQAGWVQADLALPDQARGFVRETVARWGQIDVFVHCAAVAPLASLAKIAVAEFEAVVDVNIRGWFYATQEVWRHFLKRGAGGVIVSVSSLAALDPFPGLGVYGASKAWEDLLVQALASEGQPHGIRLYAIRPGAVDTPMLDGLFPDYPAADRLAPEQVAEMIWGVCQPPFREASGQAFQIRRTL